MNRRNNMNPPILHPLPPEARQLTPPTQLNNPFSYKPHPLCLAAAEDLKPLIEALPLAEDEGKMFGVLIVESQHPISNTQQLYYLAAYSGQIGGRADWAGFVPAIYDYLQPDGYFKTHEADISQLNKEIEEREKNGRTTPNAWRHCRNSNVSRKKQRKMWPTID